MVTSAPAIAKSERGEIPIEKHPLIAYTPEFQARWNRVFGLETGRALVADIDHHTREMILAAVETREGIAWNDLPELYRDALHCYYVMGYPILPDATEKRRDHPDVAGIQREILAAIETLHNRLTPEQQAKYILSEMPILRLRHIHVSPQISWRTCGKMGCQCRTEGRKHGPYYYAYYHFPFDRVSMRSAYLGTGETVRDKIPTNCSILDVLGLIRSKALT